MTEPTRTRVTLNVPAPSPQTQMTLGAAWTAAPWNSDGFCATSVGRIWLDARGADPDTSTFGALANGGQFLLQSLQDCIYLISRESATVATNGGAFLAGGNGVKFLAGHGAPVLFAPGLHPLQNVAPSNTTPSSDTAAGYTGYMDDVSKGWAITDTVFAFALTALDIGITIADCYQGGSFAGLGACLLVLGSAANLAGGSVNIAGMEGATAPGINLHASANITFATTGFCSMYSAAGMLLCGLTTAGTGFMTAGVTASVNAALKSLGLTGVEGKNLDMVGMKSASFFSRTGELKLFGQEVLIGSKGGESKTQMPTATIKAEAVTSAELEGQLGDVALESMGEIAVDSGTLAIDGETGVLIQGPTYDVIVTPFEVVFKLAGPTKLSCDGTALKAAAGTYSLTMTATAIKLGSASEGLEAQQGGVWKWKAAAFVFG